MKQEMHKIVQEMNLDEHPKSIFTTDVSQTKVRNYYYLCPVQKSVVVI